MTDRLTYLSQLISLDEQEALDWLRDLGLDHRLVRRDHITYITTRDYKPSRINIETTHGIVEEAYYG